ncbi:MAG: UDP-N-acetylglucosamine 1-carboxyvinyltransferase [bacterium]|nr:UDP-N-acetylglucosamine 1-carboxyvinyltransferase [bacterium]
MDKIVINGGKKLEGEVSISGSKNAALPIIVGVLLSSGKTRLENIPHLKDIDTILEVIRYLGAKADFIDRHTLEIDGKNLDKEIAPYNLVKTMRASFLVIAPLLARLGKAKVSLPGGCAIGARPVNFHIKGLKQLGVDIEVEEGYVIAKTKGLRGAKIYLDFPSVGATENLIIAACLAKGETIIENAACEPEIEDLINFLSLMGAKIEGVGKNVIHIQGVNKLNPVNYKIIPDRIETGTFMIAAGITKGRIKINNAVPGHNEALEKKLLEVGMDISKGKDYFLVKGDGILKAVDIKTMPYPGFPTDIQAQMMALMTVTPGKSVVNETVFENRFMHVSELNRMGAKIEVNGHQAIVEGVPYLSGAPVLASDLRASGALILAGLVAKGRTEIKRVYHLDRGYENIEKKFSLLGAEIRREKDIDLF